MFQYMQHTDASCTNEGNLQRESLQRVLLSPTAKLSNRQNTSRYTYYKAMAHDNKPIQVTSRFIRASTAAAAGSWQACHQ